jgi:hypothetical protein
LAAQNCADPSSVRLELPDGGVVFDNANAPGDAGPTNRHADVIGALDREAQRFGCCFEEWMRDNSGRAELMLQLSLAADGTVVDAGIDARRSSFRDELTEACVTSVAAGTQYPRSPRNEATLVEYPLRAGAQAK